jgi:hypothetical protein
VLHECLRQRVWIHLSLSLRKPLSPPLFIYFVFGIGSFNLFILLFKSWIIFIFQKVGLNYKFYFYWF